MKKLLLPAVIFSSLFMTSCEDDTKDPVKNNVVLPDTYNFENVDHSGQDQRIEMLSEIIEYMETAADGAAVDADIIYDMFLNQNYTWKNTDLNGSTKDLASKTSDAVAGLFGTLADDIETASTSNQTAANGVAGTITSTTGKTRVFNELGHEPAELTEKLAMGAIFYYQATAVYLSDSKMNVDNETVEEGKGTTMQHHWDEAFGYWGVPTDFGSANFTYDKTQAYHRFWAKYTNEMNEVLGVNAKLMKAFIKGRDAINRKDYTTRDEAIAEVRDTWELIVAGMTIHYLNGAKANIADDISRNHQLSEGLGFMLSLQFNPTAKISLVTLEDLTDNFENFYEVSVADLNDAIDVIAQAYGLTGVKDAL